MLIPFICNNIAYAIYAHVQSKSYYKNLEEHGHISLHYFRNDIKYWKIEEILTNKDNLVLSFYMDM